MAVTVTINSVDRSSLVVFPSIRKQDTLNQQVDTLSFSIKKYGSMTYVPTLGHEVVVTNGATTIFGGVIIRIRETVEAGKVLGYQIDCSDYSQYLKRKLVTERYENKTVAFIVNDIVASYASDFTVVNVATGPTITSISFNRLTVAECFQKLADAISYVWYVDYTQDIHFFAKNTEVAPFELTDTSANYVYNSLEITEDLSQIRNSVLVQGGEQTSTATRTELFSGDASRVHFALANKFSSLPTVIVGTTAQTVGIEYLDADASFDCMWNFNEKYIRFTSGNTPASGTNNISVEGYYLFPIVVRVPSLASIAVYGTYEFAITDKSIVSQQEAIDRAQAELISYQNKLNDGQFITYTDGFRSGQVLTIRSTQRAKDIDVLIQSVTARMRDPLGTSFEYQVNFATMKSVGIVEYLQRQLRDREIVEDDQETLLNFIPFDSDEVSLTDSLTTPTDTTGPYKWDSFSWGYATWA